MGHRSTRRINRPGAVPVDPEVCERLRTRARRTSTAAVASLAEVPRCDVEDVLAGHPIPPERAARLVALAAEDLPPLPQITCHRCAVAVETEDRRRRHCDACEDAKREEVLQYRREYNRARYWGAPRLTAPASAASPCPECGTVRRREGTLLYCPKRCDGGLVLVKRAS
jgi:hypothetical protein